MQDSACAGYDVIITQGARLGKDEPWVQRSLAGLLSQAATIAREYAQDDPNDMYTFDLRRSLSLPPARHQSVSHYTPAANGSALMPFSVAGQTQPQPTVVDHHVPAPQPRTATQMGVSNPAVSNPPAATSSLQPPPAEQDFSDDEDLTAYIFGEGSLSNQSLPRTAIKRNSSGRETPSSARGTTTTCAP